MDSNLSHSSNSSSAHGRSRGIVLSSQGWERFQVAKQQTESTQSCGKRLTQEDLSDRTGLSINTLYRVLKRELGVDRQSLEYLFGAFGLELTKADYTLAIAIAEEDDSRLPNPHQDCEKFSKLMKYLRSRRCLLMLDSVEVILDPQRVGQWSAGYEAYGKLLKTIGETPHQSCLLLTSREQPSEITLMEDRQGTCTMLSLKGLNPADGRAIFDQKGEYTATTAQWQQLIHHYGGNPLMLKIVAASTQALFDGSIAEVVADLERGVLGCEDIRNLLDRQFKRLSTAEQKVLFCLAIQREPVSLAQPLLWRIARICGSMVALTSEQNVLKPINSLMRRSIVKNSRSTHLCLCVLGDYYLLATGGSLSIVSVSTGDYGNSTDGIDGRTVESGHC